MGLPTPATKATANGYAPIDPQKQRVRGNTSNVYAFSRDGLRAREGTSNQEEVMDDEEDDDEWDEDDEAAEEREREEMRRQFNMVVEEKRQRYRRHFLEALRRKRRLLMYNKNLRFRELYKAPEPMVLITVISVFTIVTLIVTKSGLCTIRGVFSQHFGSCSRMWSTPTVAVPVTVDRRLVWSRASMQTLLEDLAVLEDSAHRGRLDAGSPRGSVAWTPLQYACAIGDRALVETILLKTPAAVSDCGLTKYSYSPIHIAVRYGHADIVKMLLAHGATTSSTDTVVGALPLHLAVMLGHMDLVRILLDADPQVTATKNGIQPSEIAQSVGHLEMAQVLRDHEKQTLGKAQISSWLASIGMMQYAPNFFEAGFDDAQFVLEHGLSEKTLDAMNIDKPGHRLKLISLYQLAEFLRGPKTEESDEDADSDDDSSGGSDSGSEGSDEDSDEDSDA
ncbi:TPA: hypothetical protein N0F65_010646 [Lagenidium giganteum]|uniref:SAM domain-containing protein n=1 Tax=Lagenidium giganteum TaxID=4803 RepID=A0AAV2ZG64_9STRA|nr:TPA: hypothetical protein N0F65_010646 [Lagenidium giganteum]